MGYVLREGAVYPQCQALLKLSAVQRRRHVYHQPPEDESEQTDHDVVGSADQTTGGGRSRDPGTQEYCGQEYCTGGSGGGANGRKTGSYFEGKQKIEIMKRVLINFLLTAALGKVLLAQHLLIFLSPKKLYQHFSVFKSNFHCTYLSYLC